MLAADPTTIGTTPALITALGGALAAVLGAMALFGRRKPSDAAVGSPPPVPFDITRDREIERRLAILETRSDDAERRLDSHDEVMALLRAQEVTTEAHTPRRTPPRKR